MKFIMDRDKGQYHFYTHLWWTVLTDAKGFNVYVDFH